MTNSRRNIQLADIFSHLKSRPAIISAALFLFLLTQVFFLPNLVSARDEAGHIFELEAPLNARIELEQSPSNLHNRLTSLVSSKFLS